jgi:hypothetical protein
MDHARRRSSASRIGKRRRATDVAGGASTFPRPFSQEADAAGDGSEAIARPAFLPRSGPSRGSPVNRMATQKCPKIAVTVHFTGAGFGRVECIVTVIRHHVDGAEGLPPRAPSSSALPESMNCWAASFVGKVIRPFPTTPPSRSSATAYLPPIEGQVVQPIRFFTSRPFTIDRKIQGPDSPSQCKNGLSPGSGWFLKNQPQLRGWLEAEAEVPDRSRLSHDPGIKHAPRTAPVRSCSGLTSDFPSVRISRKDCPKGSLASSAPSKRRPQPWSFIRCASHRPRSRVQLLRRAQSCGQPAL